MIVEQELWGNIPLLHIHTENMNEETPVVIFTWLYECKRT